MKSWTRALATFGIGYVIATLVGVATFRIPVLMWAMTFTAMPVVFAGMAWWYFRSVRPSAVEAKPEAIRLIVLWIGLSFALDALVYIVAFPLAFGARANLTFFVDQSPWIWLCYATFVPIVFAGLHAWRKTSLAPAPAALGSPSAP